MEESSQDTNSQSHPLSGVSEELLGHSLDDTNGIMFALRKGAGLDAVLLEFNELNESMVAKGSISYEL